MNSLPQANDTGELFNRAWLDVAKFNMREMSPGYVGVHVWRSGVRCTLLTLKSSQLQDPAFQLWRVIREMAETNWAKIGPSDDPACPTCGGFLRLTRRLWQGRAFCNVCGSGVE